MSNIALDIIDKMIEKYPEEKPSWTNITEYSLGQVKKLALKEARDQIEAAYEIASLNSNETQWISVESTLKVFPDLGVNVLTKNNGPDYDICSYSPVGGWRDDDYDPCTVTHWMPLPSTK